MSKDIKGMDKSYTAGEEELPVTVGSERTQIAHSLKDGVKAIYWFTIKRGGTWEDVDIRRLPGFESFIVSRNGKPLELLQQYFNETKFNSFDEFLKS